MNSKFIGSQQTHRKSLHQIDLQETIVLRIKRERGSHLATAYGPVGLWWTTHASSERHLWGRWTPPWWCLDWISRFWNLRRLELCFVDSPRVFGISRGLCSPQHTFLALFWPTGCLLVQKKYPKSFVAIGLRLVLIFCEVKNKQKTATGTGHYVNRLVPKNDINLL